ncbi:hypothetical protein BV25DRAFT_895473 [Artomyces pyxidatus]|uniref:Uncharacterized protein n=1 Tax=Artomyces pyxidatus TaxID=48021 RepID=A0ACB8THQ6_9AGAM|nr:hypothetical protein BV25DRAFT_895473 [Artomyces pyxidatus]
MPAEISSSSAVRTAKPNTRSSSRYSLSSVGKALADVMNKEPRDDKVIKKSRDSTRRMSAIAQTSTVTRRGSLGERQADKDTSPAATITRTSRRQSGLSRTDVISPPAGATRPVPSSSPVPAAFTRRATLRPRDPANGSALPKYRPRSVLVESNKKITSPPRLGTRRRLSSSDDEKEVVKDVAKIPPPHEKAARPISPLPHRAAQSQNAKLASPSTPSKMKPPSRRTPSPTRRTPPAKVGKTAQTTSPNRSAIPRPPSSSSSSSSVRTPRTPQTPTPVRESKSKTIGSPGSHGSPLRLPPRRQTESPLGKYSKPPSRTPKGNAPAQSPSGSVFNEGSSIDSVDDVEFLLGSAISPTAPTPAIPRIRPMGRKPNNIPETPSRGSALPTRANMSYLSPMPPAVDQSPSIRITRAGNDRGSLMSWDQLVTVGDMTLGEGEVENMIADVTAPFSGTASPAISHIELAIPDSPSLSALPSPNGYNSISQILLPDVTPSPAKFAQLTPDRLGVDSSLVMMLRLQLASMENTAKERLGQIQSLEHQLASAKELRLREADELAHQVTTLEEQMRCTLETRERTMVDQTATIAHLEQQLHWADVARDNAVKDAVCTASDDAMRLKAAAVDSENRRWQVACAAGAAASQWGSVRTAAEGELELLRSNRETLSVLLAGLDQSQRQMQTLVAA